MIDFEEYRWRDSSQLSIFLNRIPERLKALASSVEQWNGTDNQKKFSYDWLNAAEDWALSLKGNISQEQVMQLCVYLGEYVISHSKGKWKLDDNDFDPEGDESEYRLIPSVFDWSNDPDDLPFTPLFSIEHFLRTRERGYLEMTVRYHIEIEGDERFKLIGSHGEDEFDIFEEVLANESSLDELTEDNSLEEAMEFIEDELHSIARELGEFGIDVSVEKDEEENYVDQNLFSESTLNAMELFYKKHIGGTERLGKEEIADMIMAYFAEYLSNELAGYPELTEEEDLLVKWQNNRDEEETLNIRKLQNEIILGDGKTVLSLLRECKKRVKVYK